MSPRSSFRPIVSVRGCAALFLGFIFLLRMKGAESAPIAFSRAQIDGAYAEAHLASPKVDFKIDPELGPQGYTVRSPASQAIVVTGGDPTGAMYGGLDVAEARRLGPVALAELRSDYRAHTPYIALRGIKFNIPLDLRTPSYSDGSDNARDNIPEMWSREFWATLFDEMARDRYNVLSLWSLNPFPSMVRVPEFPDVALNDVWRSRMPLGPVPLDGTGKNNVPPAFLASHEVVKKITIDEKITFWRQVMQMAADRGIAIYIITWNVFPYGAEGKYGITSDMSNRTTIAYYRASVRELVKTYPLLAGIGITAGENMPNNADFTKEQWLWATYGEGIRDALKDSPTRTFNLIHRYHQTAQSEITRNWQAYPGYPTTVTFSYKYSYAHMYSSVKPPFIAEMLPYLPQGMKTWLTVRNDDIYSFRWGDPDFAREYILNMPSPTLLAGFYMGPDGFIWGRDFLDRDLAGKDLGVERPLVIQKQWYAFTLWGRLAFDPTLSDSHFVEMLRGRFPGVDAATLYAASCAASKIIPQATRFFWGDIDVRWFPEANARNDRGTHFYTVTEFMNGVTMPGTGILNIRQWRYKLLNHEPLNALSPLDAADALAGAADTTLRLVGLLRADQSFLRNRELRLTLGDYEAMAYLGLYYSEKIRGACDLAFYDASRHSEQQANAIAHLEHALAAWKSYAAVRDAQYVPGFYSRIGQIDITALAGAAAKDIDLARTWKPGTLKYDPQAREKADAQFQR
jgi:hypothetical protein